MVIVLLGVAGSGKSTIGRMLAEVMGVPFFDGDDLHSPANREKLRRGQALTDADREPWLESIRVLIANTLANDCSAVIACSALKQAYRDKLALEGVHFVLLKGDFELIRERLEKRRGHFFNPKLLESQFATLEEPRDALIVDVDRKPAAIVDEIIRALRPATPARG